MPASSRRSGIPATFIGFALAVILVAGFALGPRAFEFRAWPQPSHHGAVEEVVAGPSAEATEVPVVRVRRGERERGSDESLSARGRNARRGDRVAARGVTLDARSRRRGRESGSRRSGSVRDGGSETAPPAVDETPTPATDAPVDQPADQPAQLAEVPPADQMLRPESRELESVPDQEPPVESDGLAGGVDRLIESLLPGESRRGHRGRRHGRR